MSDHLDAMRNFVQAMNQGSTHVTALLDHACGQAVHTGLTEFKTIATLDLRIDYMRPAEPGKDIFARAHCYKVTSSVAFVRAVAYDVDPKDPVAAAQAAFMQIGRASWRERGEISVGAVSL